MPYFCTLAVYLRLDIIRKGIDKYASLKKYCIWNMNDKY
jgi:hypothetical protein